jgi:hypothetical protein
MAFSFSADVFCYHWEKNFPARILSQLLSLCGVCFHLWCVDSSQVVNFAAGGVATPADAALCIWIEIFTYKVFI